MKSIQRYSPFLFMLLAAAVIAAATMAEDVWGTALARHFIYGALWFKLLWLAVMVSAMFLIVRRRLWQRPIVMGLHLSFVVILLGALVTSITSRNGTLHLRRGIPSSTLQHTPSEYMDDGVAESLPFLVRLDDFYIRYYPGTEAPQDYVSQITIARKPYTVSMNHIAQHEGWRFYQSSYDEDGEGSILSVNYDPWGTPITYLGYALLGMCIVLFLYSSLRSQMSLPSLLQQGGQGGHIRQLALAAVVAMVAAASLFPRNLWTEGGLEETVVLWNNRPTPFGSMAPDFLLKVHGSSTYQGMPATEVVAGIMKEPSRWSHESLIKVGRGDFRPLVSYINPKDGSLQGLGHNPKVDEKVALMVMLMQGSLIKPVAADAEPLSPIRIKAELLYHQHDWLLWCMLLLAIGVSCEILRARSDRLRPRLDKAGTVILHFSLFTLSFLWVLRWYISGHIPLSNGFETLIFVTMCTLLTAGFQPRLKTSAMGVSLLLLVVARMGAMNPQITPLMPVLHSPWLSAHVSIIMISYALLVLSIVERSLLRPAVCLLAVGIFLGAVWANVSWGTYWSWDPKESWALITLLVYSVPLHQQSIPWFRSLRNYRIYSLLALACLLMTYFGVNFLLGGMHSYGAS